MSQQRLAELAGIERKQLSVLEGGGNVTLATIKKIVPHLPNLQTFTLGGAPGKVRPAGPPETQVQVVEAASKALTAALQSLQTIVGALNESRVPDEQGAEALFDVGRDLYLSMGHSAEEYDQMVAKAGADTPPAEPMTEEAAAAALAAFRELAERAAADLGVPDEEEPAGEENDEGHWEDHLRSGRGKRT